MKTDEFVAPNLEQIEWHCKRCKSKVDMKKFRCKCTESPSPWEPINCICHLGSLAATQCRLHNYKDYLDE